MGIFDKEAGVFVRYHVSLELRDKIMGGVPANPKIMEAWLRTKTGLSDRSEELRQLTVRTMKDKGFDVSEAASWEEITKISEEVGASTQTNGFKFDPNGLFIETRQLKAMLREGTNVLFAGERWGTTKKGPRAYLAERVFPAEPSQVHLIEPALGKPFTTPSGVELFIGHITDRQGSRSTLTYYEMVIMPHLEFDILATEDADDWLSKERRWQKLWVYCQENGIGALRSQGFGRFDVTGWEKVS